MHKSKLNEEWNISAVRIPPLSIETVSNPGFKISLKWFHWGFCMCLLREAEYFWKTPQTLGKQTFLYNFITFWVIFFSTLKYMNSQKQWEWSLLSDTFTDVSAPDLGCLGKSVYFHFYPHVCVIHADSSMLAWIARTEHLSPTQGFQDVGEDASPAFLSLIWTLTGPVTSARLILMCVGVWIRRMLLIRA